MKKQNTKKRAIIINLLVLTFLLIAVILFAQNLVIAQTNQEAPAVNVCCEKTKNGAWCQNAPQDNCDAGFRTTPTSCEATSFCKLGCCVDSDEGLCLKNTPQKVCEVSTGTWLDDEQCNVPQCSLGCCLLGDQASLVTLTRCKRLSSIYGLETNFRSDVTTETSCIDLAFSQDTGACVFEVEFQKTCRFTTRSDCLGSAIGTSSGVNSDAIFYKDFLCSADELATDCGPTTETTCVQGKDEVYFIDSCGNPANIYDSEKVYSKDQSYWRNTVQKQESCGFKDVNGNVESRSCGNCEYLQGSLCGEGNAVKGDFVCKDLNCYNTQNGESYRNGESWCIYQGEINNGKDAVGSRHFRHVCINGEETIEACADFRNEICIEEKLITDNGEFIEAACRINRWDTCITQFEEDDCLNIDRRECYWAQGASYDGSGKDNSQDASRTGSVLANEDVKEQSQGILNEGEICLPNNPPGLKFWDSGQASTVCALGNSKQVVGYTKGLFGDKKCKENCEVLEAKWVRKMNNVCLSLGDCGSYINIAGVFTNKGAVWKGNGQRKLLDGILGGFQDASGLDDTDSNNNEPNTIVEDTNSDNNNNNIANNFEPPADQSGETS